MDIHTYYNNSLWKHSFTNTIHILFRWTHISSYSGLNNHFILNTIFTFHIFSGQIETFYASQQIGEYPLTKGLNLEGELFIADLSYIAALN